MTTPHVTELGRRLEPVVPDPFVEDLSGVRLEPVPGPATTWQAGSRTLVHEKADERIRRP